MRLIDADALKVDYLFPTTTTGTKCYQYVSMEQIQKAPTISPEQHWIPVTERLPEVSVDPYCVSISIPGVDDNQVELHESMLVLVYSECDGKPKYGIGVVIFDAVTKTYEWSGAQYCDEYIETDDVIAWMPLPDPWKGGHS